MTPGLFAGITAHGLVEISMVEDTADNAADRAEVENLRAVHAMARRDGEGAMRHKGLPSSSTVLLPSDLGATMDAVNAVYQKICCATLP